MWLKDSVLGLFPDTCDCSPTLANFFMGEKRTLNRGTKQSKVTPKTVPSVNHRPSSFVLPPNNVGPMEPLPHLNSTRHLGVAVKQLAPANLPSPLTAAKMSSGSSAAVPSVQLKRNLGAHHKKVWETWSIPGDVMGKIPLVTVVGCFVFITFKLFDMQFGQTRRLSRLRFAKPKTDDSSLAWTMDASLDHKAGQACIGGNNIGGTLRKLFVLFEKKLRHFPDEGSMQSSLPVDNLLPYNNALVKRQMPVEEAEALVQQWQAIKSEALGPDHQVQSLSEVLSESMLAQWQALAGSAKARSCFWRFVLLQLSVVRADIMSDGIGGEMAEIEALMEEAAELVDESQPKNPNYYSTYKIRYVLKRQYDGSWRFCGWGVTPT